MDILHHARTQATTPRLFKTAADRPLSLLAACPAHEVTPLHDADKLAAANGVAKLWLKDESQRMRLGSFKALGGAFAVAQMIADAATEKSGKPIAPEALMSDAVRADAAAMTFITASAGNHGLSVAAGARLFGARAVIVLSETVPADFAKRLEAIGATVQIVPGVYEDSVAHAIAEAEKNNWLLLADGSWPGYTAPPAIVMEGYTVLAEECRQSFARSEVWPTHVFVQAGVGGMAAAVSAHIRTAWGEQPTIIVVEPDAAPCLIESVRNGALTSVDGPVSNMGRLDCKDASLIAYDSLIRDADIFVTITDDEANAATSTLGKNGYATTQSGAAGVAAITNGTKIGLTADARCLAIVSEGTG